MLDYSTGPTISFFEFMLMFTGAVTLVVLLIIGVRFVVKKINNTCSSVERIEEDIYQILREVKRKQNEHS